MVSDAGGVYDGSAFPASATATGVGDVSVSGSFVVTYYAGSSVGNNGSTTPPAGGGTYTVVAAFSSADANYGNAASAPLTFTIVPLPTSSVNALPAAESSLSFPITVTGSDPAPDQESRRTISTTPSMAALSRCGLRFPPRIPRPLSRA